MVQAVVTAYSQKNRAKTALGQARQPVPVAADIPVPVGAKVPMQPFPVTHGFQGVITMAPIEVLENHEVRFCRMDEATVNSVDQPGDSGHLSDQFDLSDLKFPKPGAYRIHNVRLSTNGSNVFTETPETQYEYLGEPTLA